MQKLGLTAAAASPQIESIALMISARKTPERQSLGECDRALSPLITGGFERIIIPHLRVRNLDAMLQQLRDKGADVADEVQDMAGIGRFGWVTDLEGNRVELWQPS